MIGIRRMVYINHRDLQRNNKFMMIINYSISLNNTADSIGFSILLERHMI